MSTSRIENTSDKAFDMVLKPASVEDQDLAIRRTCVFNMAEMMYSSSKNFANESFVRWLLIEHILHVYCYNIVYKMFPAVQGVRTMERLRGIASRKVIAIAERASKRAVVRNNMHNFWSAVLHCYLRIDERFMTLSYLFPGIRRVIHCSEILSGDVLVSDFHSGMNLGFLEGGDSPVKIRVLRSDGDTITGKVVGVGIGDIRSMRYVGTTGKFKNEIWYFVAHKFAVIEGFKRDR